MIGSRTTGRDGPTGACAEVLLMPTVLRACAYAFAMGAVMDFITLLTSHYATPGVRATYAVMILCYVGFLVLFKTNRHRLLTDERFSVAFVRMAWGVVATGLLVRMAIALFTADELTAVGDAVLSVFVGLIVLYLLAFILLTKRQAMAASAFIMGSSMLMVAIRVAIEAGPVSASQALPYGRAYGVHAIIVAYLYVLSTSKEMLSASHDAATALTVTAGTDELTGLANRRQLSATLNQEIAGSRRNLLPLAVILVDIDHFKKVNDTHGHAAGDDVLQSTADILRQGTRESDLTGRWGGEEFLLVLPSADVAAATLVAERCRTALRSHEFSGVGTVTASFGVAVLEPFDEAESLVARADEALYLAKEQGRDRVVRAPDSIDPTLQTRTIAPTIVSR